MKRGIMAMVAKRQGDERDYRDMQHGNSEHAMTKSRAHAATGKSPQDRDSGDWEDIAKHQSTFEDKIDDRMSGSRSYAAGGQVQPPVAFRGGRSFRSPQFSSPNDDQSAATDGGGGGGATTTGTLLDQKSNPYFNVDGRGSGERLGIGNDLSGLPVNNTWEGVRDAAMNIGKFAASPVGFFADVLIDAALGNNNSRPNGRANALKSAAAALIGPKSQPSTDQPVAAPRDLTPGGAPPSGPSQPGVAPGTGVPGQNYDPVSDFSRPGETRGGAGGSFDPSAPPGPAPGPTGGFTDTVADLDASARSAEAAQTTGGGATAGGGATPDPGPDGIGSGVYEDGGPIPGEIGEPVPITAHAKEYVLPVEFMQILGESLTGEPDADAAAAILDEIVMRAIGKPTNSGIGGADDAMEDMAEGEVDGADGEQDDEQEDGPGSGGGTMYGQSPQRAPSPPQRPGSRLMMARSGPPQFTGR